MSKTPNYKFPWNEAEAAKLAAYYQDNWAEKAKKSIRQPVALSIPTEYQEASLNLDPEGKEGRSFAVFVENEIPNPWQFSEKYDYAFSFDGNNCYQLQPLSPWIWKSQKNEQEQYLIQYGLNSELIKMMLEKGLELNSLRVLRFKKQN